MNCLLIGNGFDLHHGLPTRYIDVLNIFKFISLRNFETDTTVGDILSAYLTDHCDDSKMQSFYRKYEEHLKTIAISNNKIIEVVAKIKNNCWFKYICKAYENDISWVDFEQVIEEVLNIFEIQFDVDSGSEELPTACISDEQFRFFSCFDNVYHINLSSRDFKYREEFLFQKVYEYKKRLDVKKITEALYGSLVEFKEALCFYFEYFIDKTIPKVCPSTAINFISNIDFVINLNYTSTYETLYHISYSKDGVVYYHGKAAKNNIVLGIQSSREDEYQGDISPDTLFIKFKKYFQRINGNCDDKYVESMTTKIVLKKRYASHPYHEETPNTLDIIGHSLDVTDIDIIKWLFDISETIRIHYHDEQAFSNYIINLTRIFGRSNFENMRNTGKIVFSRLQEYSPISISEFIENATQIKYFNSGTSFRT